MEAGKLRKRVSLQRPSTTFDAHGQEIVTYLTYMTVWASVVPLTGRERVLGEQIKSDVTVQVTIRHVKGVAAKHRVLFGERVLEIDAPLNTDERNRQLVLLCREVK